MTTIVDLFIFICVHIFEWNQIIPVTVFETRRSELGYTSSEKEKVRALFNFEKCVREILYVVQISHQLLDQFLILESQSKLNVSKILILITDFKM